MTAPLWQDKNEKNHTVRGALSTDMTSNILTSTNPSSNEGNSRSSSVVNVRSEAVVDTPVHGSSTRKRLACTNCRNRRKNVTWVFPVETVLDWSWSVMLMMKI